MTATEPQREVPADGLAEGLHEPTPIRVVDFDLELPTPQIEADERYDAAWLVGRRAGVPQGIVEVDLSPGAAPVQRQIASLVARPAARTTPGWDRVDDSELPRISVVVPTIVARTEELARGLAGFDRLDYPDVEIILVDNRRSVPAEDPLPGLIADRPWVRVVRATRPGISAARNAGLEAATGTVVVFTDDDVRVDPGWLRSIGRRFVLEPGLDAITGLILPEELDTPAQLWFERYYGGFSGGRTYEPITLQAGSGPVGRARVVARDVDGREIRRFAVYGVGAYGAGANMAFRHSTLVELGGFDLALGTGTPARGGEDLATLIDVLWNGGRVGYEPAAVVHHQHRRGYDELLRQLHGNGVGFTAMLTSLVLADPRHLIALAAQLPLAVWRMVGQSVDRLRAGASADAEDAGPRYPRELVTNELRGFPSGPLAYLRSRRSVRAWTRRHGAESQRPGIEPAVSRRRSRRAVTGRGRIAEAASHLRQDARVAGEHLLLTVLGGSVFLPGTIRKLIFRLAGAMIDSPPGFGFVFAGRARNLRVGPNVYMNQRVFVEAVGPVTIGADSALGMEAMILTSHHLIDDRGSWDPEATGRPVSIGDRVWVGARAIILPGAVIESDVIVAAGAVVSGICRSHGVYAGVPARRIKEFAQPVG